jgi:hypothetical protein
MFTRLRFAQRRRNPKTKVRPQRYAVKSKYDKNPPNALSRRSESALPGFVYEDVTSKLSQAPHMHVLARLGSMFKSSGCFTGGEMVSIESAEDRERGGSWNIE